MEDDNKNKNYKKRFLFNGNIIILKKVSASVAL